MHIERLMRRFEGERMRADEMAYEWWLAGIRGISAAKKRKLREVYGNGRNVFEYASHIHNNIEEKRKKRADLLTPNEIQILNSEAQHKDVPEAYERFLEEQVRFVPYFSEEFPERMREQKGMPYALYVKGELPREDMPTAAVIGARNCTHYGQAKAIDVAGALAERGFQIISGMAKGIDGIAQRAALQAGGVSFAVLGCGVDVCYPKENRGLYRDLSAKGGLISEFQNGTPPLREHFPARNRIISALADVVIVIEARKKSGSLITCDFALEQGKDVYALPGPVDSELSMGCHELIRQGAGILLSTESLMEDLNIRYVPNKQKNNDLDAEKQKSLESEEVLVYACVDLFPKNLDQIIAETGMKTEVIMRILFSLELKGYVREITKNNYVKV